MEGTTLQRIYKDVSYLQGVKNTLEKQKNTLENDILSLQEDRGFLLYAAEVFRKFLDEEVNFSTALVAGLATKGLKAVFTDQDLRVDMETEVSRGKVSLKVTTVQETLEGFSIEGSATESFGGSVSAVQSIILRVFLILKHRLRPVLFLDETLPAFDQYYVTRMAKFLKTLCQEFSLDILVVTHNPLLMDEADRALILKRTSKGLRVDEEKAL